MPTPPTPSPPSHSQSHSSSSVSTSTSNHLQDLEREQAILKPLQSAVPNAWSILEAEIRRLRSAQPDTLTGATATTGSNNSSIASLVGVGGTHHQNVTSQQQGTLGRGSRTKKKIRIDIDVDKAPVGYNYVGRILGPRGATLKTLEKETGCRIMIRGRGSIRKDKEEEMKGKPGWEHVFEDNLHVVCEVPDTMDEYSQLRALKRAKEAVELLLVPVPDEKDSLKRQQLRDLAILNGTYRHHHHHHAGGINGGASRHHHHPPPSLSGINAGHTISPDHLAQSMHANRAVHPPSHANHHPHHPHSQIHPSQSPAFQLTAVSPSVSSTTLEPSNIQNDLSKLSLSSSPQQPKASTLSNTFAAQHQGARRPPNLRLPSFPSLDLDGLNDQPTKPMTPLGSMNPVQVPLASPTIVDPDLYPFPPTPSVVGSSDKGFGSPIWSSPSLPRSNSAHAGSGGSANTGAFRGAGHAGIPGGRSFARSASFGTPSRSSADLDDLVGGNNLSDLDGEPIRRLKPGDRSLSSGAKLPRGKVVGDNLPMGKGSATSTATATFDKIFSDVASMSPETHLRYRGTNGESERKN